MSGSPEELAERFSSRQAAAVAEVSGQCTSVALLRDGRTFWTLRDLGKIECYDLEAKCPEWIKEHGGALHALCYVDGDPPKLWVTDTERDRILLLDPGNGEMAWAIPNRELPAAATLDGKALLKPLGLTLWEDVPQPGSSEIWVADSGNHRLLGFDLETGAAIRSMSGNGLLTVPTDVTAMDMHRLASVCRRGGHIFSPRGELLARFNWHLMVPSAVTFDDRGLHGLLITADEYTQRISIFDGGTGAHLRTLSDTGICEGSFAIKGMVMNDDEQGTRRIMIADSGNRRICSVVAST